MTATHTTHSPSSADAFVQLYRLFLRGQLTRLRAFGLLTLGAIAIVLTAIAPTTEEPLEFAVGVLAEYGLVIVAPVCTLWVASSLLGELVEDRLLAYLWLKPVPRWIMPAAALGAVLTVMVPLVVAPLTVAAAVSGFGELVVPTLTASLLAVAAYGGVFVALGARFSRALLVGAGYILVWENIIARLSDGAALVSVRGYVVSILSQATDVDLALADRSTAASIIVPIGIAIAGVALGAVVLTRSDID